MKINYKIGIVIALYVLLASKKYFTTGQDGASTVSKKINSGLIFHRK